MKKIFLITFFTICILFLFGFSAYMFMGSFIIPAGDERIDRCISIDNLEEYPDLYFMTYITGPKIDGYNVYIIEEGKCLNVEEKRNILRIAAAKKHYINFIGLKNIHLPDENILLSDLEIDAHGEYMRRGWHISREYLTYTILGFVEDKLILYKSHKKYTYKDIPDVNNTWVEPEIKNLRKTFFDLRQSAPFIDVKTDSPYFNAIEYIKREGIVDGYDDGSSFIGYDYIKRDEFIKIIINDKFTKEEIGFCNSNKYSFSDVDDWANPYVCMAKYKKIINGYDDNTFRPKNNISLLESLKIILETYNIKSVFKKEDFDNWYDYYYRVAEYKNLLINVDKSKNHLLTREEMAQLIYNIRSIR